jgi:hypothetical protein
MNQKSNFHLLRDFRNRTEAVSTSYAVGRRWPGLKDERLELFSKLGGHLNPAKGGHPKTGQWRARQDNSSYSPNRPRASRLAFIAELRADDEGPVSQIEVPRDRERKPRRPPPALQMAANIEIESSEANFNLSATSGFARTTDITHGLSTFEYFDLTGFNGWD